MFAFTSLGIVLRQISIHNYVPSQFDHSNFLFAGLPDSSLPLAALSKLRFSSPVCYKLLIQLLFYVIFICSLLKLVLALKSSWLFIMRFNVLLLPTYPPLSQFLNLRTSSFSFFFLCVSPPCYSSPMPDKVFLLSPLNIVMNCLLICAHLPLSPLFWFFKNLPFLDFVNLPYAKKGEKIPSNFFSFISYLLKTWEVLCSQKRNKERYY